LVAGVYAEELWSGRVLVSFYVRCDGVKAGAVKFCLSWSGSLQERCKDRGEGSLCAADGLDNVRWRRGFEVVKESVVFNTCAQLLQKRGERDNLERIVDSASLHFYQRASRRYSCQWFWATHSGYQPYTARSSTLVAGVPAELNYDLR
jgi:hypothetical protein